MANGEWPHQGACAVSNRTIPLGSKIKVLGRVYIVKDRTARWVHKKHGFTVDIYEPNLKKCLKFGRKKLLIKIFYS